jgi:hypothetical protein
MEWLAGSSTPHIGKGHSGDHIPGVQRFWLLGQWIEPKTNLCFSTDLFRSVDGASEKMDGCSKGANVSSYIAASEVK